MSTQIGSSSSLPPPPPSLTPARMSFGAMVAGSVTYGMYVILAGICMHFLIKRRVGPWHKQITLLYTVLMFAVNTTYFISAAKWSEVEFVETTTNPALYATLQSSNLAVCKDTAFTVGTWLADSLIVYRLYIVWGKTHPVVIVPSFYTLPASRHSASRLYRSGWQPLWPTNTGITTWSISVALNVLCTVLIAGRLLRLQPRTNSSGFKSDEYISLAAVFAESAALYSIVGIIYIPLFGKNIPLAYPITAIWASVTVIAPNLIILRIALGIDVSKHPSFQTTKVSIASLGENTVARGTGTTTVFWKRESAVWTDKDTPKDVRRLESIPSNLV